MQKGVQECARAELRSQRGNSLPRPRSPSSRAQCRRPPRRRFEPPLGEGRVLLRRTAPASAARQLPGVHFHPTKGRVRFAAVRLRAYDGKSRDSRNLSMFTPTVCPECLWVQVDAADRPAMNEPGPTHIASRDQEDHGPAMRLVPSQRVDGPLSYENLEGRSLPQESGGAEDFLHSFPRGPPPAQLPLLASPAPAVGPLPSAVAASAGVFLPAYLRRSSHCGGNHGNTSFSRLPSTKKHEKPHHWPGDSDLLPG